MSPVQATSYDEVPYTSLPFPQTHPARLAAVARLLGMEPNAPEGARVLELGCAAGGNLIPMAITLPGARLVGIDLSSVQIAEGEKTLRALGAKNVRLLHRSISDVDESFGAFDYVIAHGVYSWVPDAVQEKILEICARQLAPNGIAFVSYNTLPGWRMRGMIRDLMRFHAMQFTEPSARVAQGRAILDYLAACVPDQGTAYGVLLKAELELLRQQPDYYILHEHLEDVNEPVYFHQFAERAMRHGLQYLAEADFGTMLTSVFPPNVADTLRQIAPDLLRQEQLIDFLRNRTFRQTLLTHADVPLNRVVTPDRLHRLYVASPAQPEAPMPDLGPDRAERFSVADGSAVTTPESITKAGLLVLQEHWPGNLSFSELLDAARRRLGREEPGDLDTLGSDLLQCYAVGLVELGACRLGLASKPGRRPHASPLARYQARVGVAVTNLRHESVDLAEALRRLLVLLDGRRTVAELNRMVKGVGVEDGLGLLARAGLLMG